VTGYDGPFTGERSVTAPSARQMAAVDRYQVDVWYPAEVGRIIKLQHRTWGGGRILSDDLVELVEYRAPR
jgi:hypothetical protein